MTPDVIFDRAIPEPNSGCWLWEGYCDSWGYGRYHQSSAHRLSYEVHKGSIPKGKCILHSCDQPSCVNPDHLRIGSHGENAQDRDERGRSNCGRGERHGFAKLTEEKVRLIRADKRPAKIAAADYGISRWQFRNIQKRVYWKEVP